MIEGNVNAQATQESPVLVSVKSIGSRIEELDVSLSQLISRIVPILRQNASTPEQPPDGGPRAGRSPLMDDLASCERGLATLNTRVREITKSLDL